MANKIAVDNTPELRSEIKVEVELHIWASADMIACFGKKIVKAGGRYTRCTGSNDTRYVTLPIEAAELIDALVTRYPHPRNRTSVVVRESSNTVTRDSFLLSAHQCAYTYVKGMMMTPSQFVAASYAANRAMVQIVRRYRSAAK